MVVHVGEVVNTVFHKWCIDFVAIMFFTRQVFHLQFFNSFLFFQLLLLFSIKSQPGVAYKSVVNEKTM